MSKPKANGPHRQFDFILARSSGSFGVQLTTSPPADRFRSHRVAPTELIVSDAHQNGAELQLPMI